MSTAVHAHPLPADVLREHADSLLRTIEEWAAAADPAVLQANVAALLAGQGTIRPLPASLADLRALPLAPPWWCQSTDCVCTAELTQPTQNPEPILIE